MLKVTAVGKFLVLAASLLLFSPAALGESPKIYVYAAASVQAPLEMLATLYERTSNVQISAATGSSGDLARQIEQGAPANLFISANTEWMDYLQGKKLTMAETRRNLLGNRLALVSSPCVEHVSGAVNELLAKFPNGRIAMANPGTAPAGAYAKQAFIKLGQWEKVLARAAFAEDVRATLNWVARCETDIGVVYKSDALAGAKLGIFLAAEFPLETHAPILYPMALIAGRDTPHARAFADYLASDAAFAVFEAFGFSRP